MVDFFIHRPVFATVCALLIILAGAVVIPSLPISLYPQLAPPQVTVTSAYIGANSSQVESAVTIPLEEAINGVPGMRYIQSTSANDGTSAITTTFNTGYDLDVAAVDVQNRVSSASGLLPAEVNQTGITVSKANSNFVFGAGIYADHGQYSNLFMSNYLDVYIKDALKRVKGVGDVQIFGVGQYAMRIWLDPVKLAARQLTATDVIQALQEQNVEVPSGQLGAPPSNSTQSFQISVNVIGRLTTPEQFDNIIIKNTPNGIVQIRDVGRAELGSSSYASTLTFDGIPAVGFGVQQLSDANALQVDRDAKAELARLAKSFPPGMKYAVAFDTTTIVGASIHEVIKTLIEAIIIVIAVIFFFLQDWRATLIPAITIPVSLIGTFAFIRIFGFSINSLTLFGITLATGLVVDDAIVVIENVQRHISEGDNEPHHATSAAMGEVTSAVIATSLVLIAVFVPVSFFPGTTGILYRQFSLTIAFSIAISAFNALTLSPALAALLLRREDEKHSILHLAQRSIKALGRGYARTIHGVLRLRWIMVLLFFVGLFGAYWEYTHVPTAFVPEEDQGFMMILVQAPQGASLAYTTHIEAEVSALLNQDKDVAGSFAVGGFSFSGNAPNYGMMFCALAPYDQRRGPEHSAEAIVNRFRTKFFMIPGALIIPLTPPAIQGVGTLGGFQFELEDRGSNSLTDLANTAHKLVAIAGQNKNLVGMYTSFTANDPQVLVRIDREKAKALGVPFSQISDALQVYMGSEYVNNFDFNNRSYRVYVQAEQQYRDNASDIRQYYVRSSTNQMIPLDNLVAIENTSGPQVVSHYNLFRSAEIDGSAAPGVSTSVALHTMEQVADHNMMHGMAYDWTGLALEEIESAGKAVIIFGLGILVVYLTLAALYESFALPFIILLAVPMAVLGALLAQSLRGYADDIYCQIGLVMLIGLAAKNSILIVEFAEQLRAQGRSIVDAAIEAAELRLRPILMTSFAFILGVIPLAIASGAGAQGRRSVGTTIIGGMLVSSVLNLFFIPVLYVLLQTLLGKFGGNRSSRRPAQSVDTGAYASSVAGGHTS
ncbi:MAG TPA: multidrug efflux RND transporter permease subunit [Acidobacteriaceae bacterium]|nr:multidrug efflux RND transporter permease subunit [Acidobacteriaceae bacterium]